MQMYVDQMGWLLTLLCAMKDWLSSRDVLEEMGVNLGLCTFMFKDTVDIIRSTLL